MISSVKYACTHVNSVVIVGESKALNGGSRRRWNRSLADAGKHEEHNLNKLDTVEGENVISWSRPR